MREEKTAEQILTYRLAALSTPENNRAPIETQLKLIVQAGALAMEEYASIRTEQLQKENSELKDELKFQAAHFEDENSKLKQENERFRALLKRSLLYVEQSEWLAAIEFEDEIESALGGKETN